MSPARLAENTFVALALLACAVVGISAGARPKVDLLAEPDGDASSWQDTGGEA